MDTIDRVEKLVAQYVDSSYIARQLGISRGSLSAYKANITKRGRKDKLRGAISRLVKYMKSDYIVIPSSRVLERLPSQKVPAFVKILDLLLKDKENHGLEAKVSRVSGDISKSETDSSRKRYQSDSDNNEHIEFLYEDEILNTILELKRKGVPNEEVYEDRRLEGVNPGSIRSYLSHVTMGTYKNRKSKR